MHNDLLLTAVTHTAHAGIHISGGVLFLLGYIGGFLSMFYIGHRVK